ncbi:Calcipressin-1 [Sciurus carolinensis]|uniref:Calcipressin-1 n=1 Tax=Sciurus carolinensis TaxID=30640 RepID=A0AA41T724_SCICA|nr:Calcipressin-1 [Sciurus carolinensis]
MEEGAAGPLGAEAEAAEVRGRPGVTLRPFGKEEVDLQDLPSATTACHLDPGVFVDCLCR